MVDISEAHIKIGTALLISILNGIARRHFQLLYHVRPRLTFVTWMSQPLVFRSLGRMRERANILEA